MLASLSPVRSFAGSKIVITLKINKSMKKTNFYNKIL